MANHNCSRRQILRHPNFQKKISHDITWELSASRQFSWNLMPYCYFWKSGKIWNCCLLQIVGGALRVKLDLWVLTAAFNSSVLSTRSSSLSPLCMTFSIFWAITPLTSWTWLCKAVILSLPPPPGREKVSWNRWNSLSLKSFDLELWPWSLSGASGTLYSSAYYLNEVKVCVKYLQNLTRGSGEMGLTKIQYVWTLTPTMTMTLGRQKP